MGNHSRLSGRMPAWVDRGILVYGPRKAGTTLFQNLLDGSAQLLAYPAELKLKYFARHPDKADDISAYYAKSRVASLPRKAYPAELKPEDFARHPDKADDISARYAKSRAAYLHSPRFDATEYKRLWAEALAQRELFSSGDFIRADAWAVQKSLRASTEPEMWCAKEVGGPAHIILSKWRSMFPNGRALFIVRDPLMITRAILNDRRRRKIRLPLHRIMRETLDSMRVVSAQFEYLDDPYVHILTYEDLVEDTAGTMAKVAEFLGIPYSPIFTTPTIFGEPQIVSTSSHKTTEVFAGSRYWTDGLTDRERRIISLTKRIAWRIPRYRVDYSRFRNMLGSPLTHRI